MTTKKKRRVCQQCGKDQAAINFTGTSTSCKKCEEKYRKFIKNDKVENRKELERKLAVIAASLGQSKKYEGQDVVSSIIDGHGGLGRFVSEWRNQHDIAKDQEAGSRKVLDYYRDVTRLIMAASANQPELPDVGDLSDEDLDRELADIAGRIRIHKAESA